MPKRSDLAKVMVIRLRQGFGGQVGSVLDGTDA